MPQACHEAPRKPRPHLSWTQGSRHARQWCWRQQGSFLVPHLFVLKIFPLIPIFRWSLAVLPLCTQTNLINVLCSSSPLCTLPWSATTLFLFAATVERCPTRLQHPFTSSSYSSSHFKKEFKSIVVDESISSVTASLMGSASFL
jgi:hypothetical protein